MNPTKGDPYTHVVELLGKNGKVIHPYTEVNILDRDGNVKGFGAIDKDGVINIPTSFVMDVILDGQVIGTSEVSPEGELTIKTQINVEGFTYEVKTDSEGNKTLLLNAPANDDTIAFGSKYIADGENHKIETHDLVTAVSALDNYGSKVRYMWIGTYQEYENLPQQVKDDESIMFYLTTLED